MLLKRIRGAYPFSFLCMMVFSRVFFSLWLVLGSTLCWSQVDFLELTLEGALAKSRAKNKLVFVDFRADWCKPCVEMENTTFKDKLVGEKIDQNYIPIQVDVDFFAGMDIQEAYNASVLPTLLLLNGKGDVQLRMIGQKNSVGLLKELGLIEDTSYEYDEEDTTTKKEEELDQNNKETTSEN